MTTPTPSVASDYIGRHQVDCPADKCEHEWCYLCRCWYELSDPPCGHVGRYPSTMFANWARRKARQKADRAELNILRAKGLEARHAAKLARKDTP